MSLLDKKYILTINLEDSTITYPLNMAFFNTDKNIANLYVKVQYRDEVIKYISKTDAVNYNIKLTVIKPKSNNLKEVQGIITNDFEEDYAIYKFELPSEFTDQVGLVVCEFLITNANEILTTSSFSYTIKASKVTGLNPEIIPNPDLPVLKQLIEDVKSAQQWISNIDDKNVSEVKTYSNKKIEDIKAKVDEQFISIEKIRLNVNSLGLYGNTLLPCTDKLQELLNFSDRRLFFPAGRYIIDKLIIINSDTDILCDNNAEFYLADNSYCQMFATNIGQQLKNIKWIGGIINGNNDGQGEIIERPTQSGNSHWNFSNGFVFHNVENLHVEGMKFKNIRGQSIHHWNCNHVTFRKLDFDSAYDLNFRPNGAFRTDGINGASSNMLIEDITGFTDDDMIAVVGGVSWGGTQIKDIENITIRNVYCNSKDGVNTYAAIRIACCNGYKVKNVTIENVKGTAATHGIRLGGYDDFWGGTLEGIFLCDVDLDVANKTYAFPINIQQCYCNLLKISDSKFTIRDSGTVFINNENSKILDLDINNTIINFKSNSQPQLIRDVLNNNLALNNNFIDNIFINNLNVVCDKYTDEIYVINRYETVIDENNKNRVFSFVGDVLSRNKLKSVNDGFKYIVNSKTLGFDLIKLSTQKEDYYCKSKNGDVYVTRNNSKIMLYGDNKKIVNNYYSFTPYDKLILLDGSDGNTFRLEEDVSQSFPIGYEVVIMRTDNQNTTPYIKLNSYLNGALENTIVLFTNDSITLKFVGENKWIIKNWEMAKTNSFLPTGGIGSNVGRILTNTTDKNTYILKYNSAGNNFMWVQL